jgi:hypothetical protein
MKFKVGDKVRDDEVISGTFGTVSFSNEDYISVRYEYNTIEYFYNMTQVDGYQTFHVSDLTLVTPLEELL